jgi:hypothetical protein
VEFPYHETTAFEDLETGAQLPLAPQQLRAQYRALLQNHIATLRQRLGESRIDYAFFNTTQPLDHALSHYLSERARLSRVR